MLKIVLFLVAAFQILGAENTWDKLRDLKTGVELRVYKKGSRTPVMCTMDEATDDHLIVVVKKEQIAIEKDDIDRVDYRPPAKSKMTKETRTTQSDTTQTTPVGPTGQGRSGPSSSTTTTYSSASKPDFETIYRRTAK